MKVIQFNENEIDMKIEDLKKNGKTDREIASQLMFEGFTLDSFRYDPERYKWFQHALKSV